MKRIRIPAAVLAVCLLLTGCGLHFRKESRMPDIAGAQKKIEVRPDAGQKPADEARPAGEAAPAAEGKGILPEYVHYDPTDFCARCREMAEMKDFEQIWARYQELFEEALRVEDIYTVAYIRYSEDVSDAAAEDEHLYIDETLTEVEDSFSTACHEIAAGPFAADFRARLNDDGSFYGYLGYVPMSGEHKELAAMETRLVSDYYTLMDNCGSVSIDYRGKSYDLDFFDSVESELLYRSNPYRYYEIYESVLAEINRQAGEIFLELVRIRDRIAGFEGYDNYCDYADEVLYGRDYSAWQLEPLWKASRSVGKVYDDAYNYSFPDSMEVSVSPDEMVAGCGELISEISPLAADCYRFLRENGLYSVGREENRMSGAYTIDVANGKTAFIFQKMTGRLSDYATFAHEFGHFCAMNTVPSPNLVLGGGCLDVIEIHSTGLQMLFSSSAGSLYGDEADYQQAYDLADMLGYVVEGCIYDEWQRWVYTALPDTVDELNEAYRRIMLAYGTEDFYGMDYNWIWVSHNFENPMYYVSYATSGFAALQIWAKAQEDFEEAVRLWENVVRENPYDRGYCEIVGDAGMALFYEGDTAERVLGAVAARIRELS